MNNAWFASLEAKIFNIVSYRLKRSLGMSDSDIKCTTDGQSSATAVFPTFYLHELSPVETGNDIENKTINALTETIEIIVYTKNRQQCKKIINEAVLQMKAISFDVTMMPIITTDDNVYSGVARFRRIVGSGDTDLV